MFLKYLTIKVGGEIIRNIPFHKGINFIVDNTPYKGDKESGNNVGKTTVLRLIDYCLASSGKDIFYDKEFKNNQNSEVKNYLAENNAEVEIALVDDLKNPLDEIVISRNFLSRKLKFVKINGDLVTEDDHKRILSARLFYNFDDKPTFRNLIAKFIRDDSFKMSHTLRYLHQTTSNVQYEALHLFLLGIHMPEDVFGEKHQLTLKLAADENIHHNLSKEFTENALRQALVIINRDIEELETIASQFNLDATENEDVSRLNFLKSEINRISARVADRELRITLINESINDLKQGINKSEIEQIRQMYLNAHSLIPNLQVRFEEVVEFHNTMLEKKYSFITKELDPLQQDLEKLKIILKRLLVEERVLSESLKETLSLEDYNHIISELTKKYELKGNKEERLKQLVSLNESISLIKKRLAEIIDLMSETEVELSKNEEVFNKFFARYSKELYDEEYFLTHEKDKSESFIFEIRNIQANVGGGKKKGQIAAFDLAYISFCEEKNIKAPRFELHDSTEDVSITQLIKIAELSAEINGQYILAILKDKFTSNARGKEIIDANTVIELSQEDKLFRF